MAEVGGTFERDRTTGSHACVLIGDRRNDPLFDLVLELLERLVRAEVVQLHVPLRGESHPWKAIAGSWRNHPDRSQFEQNMREYRQLVDEDPDRL